MQQLLAFLNRPGGRYLIVGGTVYALELLIIFVAQAAGTSALMAVGLAYCIGTLVSFLLQKLVTFGDKRMHHKVLGMQLVATIALVAFNLGFTLLLTQLLQNHLPAVVIRTGALLVTTLWNFYLYKTRIFKTSEDHIYA